MLYAAASDSSIAGLYRPVVMRKTFDREASGPCFVMPVSFFKFRDVLPAFHVIGGCSSVHDFAATSDAVADAPNTAVSPT